MSCEKWHAQMIGLLDDELEADDRAALEAHLSGCEQCRQDLAELRSTSAVLRRWQPEEPPQEFVFTRRHRRRSLREIFAAFGPRALVPAGLGAAAAAAILVLVFAGRGPDAEVQALRSEVAELSQRLAAAEASLSAPPLVAAAAPAGAGPEAAGATPGTGEQAPMVRLDPGERAHLLTAVRDLIRDSEARQDAKFLFTADQLARSLSIQRREDLRTVDRQLRDVRSETFSALVTTNERLDRIVAPSLGEPAEEEGAGEDESDELDLEDSRQWRGPGERLEPR